MTFYRMTVGRIADRLVAPVTAALLVCFTSLPAHAVEVQRVISPGGIEAWLVEDHTLPIIALSLAFRGGALGDPDGKEGLGEMVSSLLDEGAGDIGSQRFQQILRDQSISMGFDAYRDTFNGSLQTLTRNRDQAFEMLRLALTEPRFDPRPVERIRGQIQAYLARQEKDPDYIVGRAFWQHAFPDHPYGRPRRGTVASVGRITDQDLRAYVQQRFAKDVLYIGVVGDITEDELVELLDETFGGLPDAAAPLAVSPVTPETHGETVVIEHDVPQSTVVFGHRGIARDDPDFYAAFVLNHILGGGSFTSRLYNEVREERGLAYSVHTFLNPMDYSALIMGSVGTGNGDVAESISLIRKEWAEMQANAVTEKELQDTITNLTGAFPLRLDSSDSIASMLVGIQLEELGIDYIDRRNNYIEAVTLEDVKRVAAELLQPDSLTMVIVGRPDGIAATQ